ncbi:MAG: cupin domain-containing protein [Marinomonas sp.]
MNSADPAKAPYPSPQHALGQASKRRILCNESHFRIYHESVIQDEQHSRFYHFPNDAFVFLLAGQAYLSDADVGTALNQYQGTWIKPNRAHKLVLLSPSVELLIVAYQGNLAPCANEHYLLNQSSKSKIENNESINRQTISHIESLSIDLETYPENEAEHLHYHRQSRQFIMSLKGDFNLLIDKKEVLLEKFDWALVNEKQRHRLKNLNQDTSQCLSIYSPPPAKDRVLVIKKK